VTDHQVVKVAEQIEERVVMNGVAAEQVADGDTEQVASEGVTEGVPERQVVQ
jgi:hypothetical protein